MSFAVSTVRRLVSARLQVFDVNPCIFHTSRVAWLLKDLLLPLERVAARHVVVARRRLSSPSSRRRRASISASRVRGCPEVVLSERDRPGGKAKTTKIER